LRQERAARVVAPQSLQVASGTVQVAAGIIELYQPQQCVIGPATGGMFDCNSLELAAHLGSIARHHGLGIEDLGIQGIARWGGCQHALDLDPS
jgi:hypothetical protein